MTTHFSRFCDEIGKMTTETLSKDQLTFKPLTAAEWQDFLLLFEEHGPQQGCWCSIAPREQFAVLDRSPTLKRVDDQPVWSIVCFFISKPYRRRGLTGILIEEAIEYARAQGTKIIEAYPLKTEITKLLPYERFMGIESTFERAGFQVVTSRSDRRSVMRCFIDEIISP
jgi:GNAT superfamily N-acetyltransferase